MKFGGINPPAPQLFVRRMTSGDKLNPMIRTVTVIFTITVIFAGCTGQSWSPPKPGTVMAELTNPGKNMTAQVLATKDQGTYIFEIRKIPEGVIAAQQMISAPVGYHKHIVSISWNHDSRIFSATIDHDFGDDKRVFNISTMNSGV